MAKHVLGSRFIVEELVKRRYRRKMVLLKQGVRGAQVEEAESSKNRALGFIWCVYGVEG